MRAARLSALYTCTPACHPVKRRWSDSFSKLLYKNRGFNLYNVAYQKRDGIEFKVAMRDEDRYSRTEFYRCYRPSVAMRACVGNTNGPSRNDRRFSVVLNRFWRDLVVICNWQLLLA